MIAQDLRGYCSYPGWFYLNKTRVDPWDTSYKHCSHRSVMKPQLRGDIWCKCILLQTETAFVCWSSVKKTTNFWQFLLSGHTSAHSTAIDSIRLVQNVQWSHYLFFFIRSFEEALKNSSVISTHNELQAYWREIGAWSLSPIVSSRSNRYPIKSYFYLVL